MTPNRKRLRRTLKLGKHVRKRLFDSASPVPPRTPSHCGPSEPARSESVEPGSPVLNESIVAVEPRSQARNESIVAVEPRSQARNESIVAVEPAPQNSDLNIGQPATAEAAETRPLPSILSHLEDPESYNDQVYLPGDEDNNDDYNNDDEEDNDDEDDEDDDEDDEDDDEDDDDDEEEEENANQYSLDNLYSLDMGDVDSEPLSSDEEPDRLSNVPSLSNLIATKLSRRSARGQPENEEEEEEVEEVDEEDNDLVAQDPESEILNNNTISVEKDVPVLTPPKFRQYIAKMRDYSSSESQQNAKKAFHMAANLVNSRASFDWAASSEPLICRPEIDPNGPHNAIVTHTLDFTSIDSLQDTNFAAQGHCSMGGSGVLTFAEWAKPYASYRAYTATHSYFQRVIKIGTHAGSEMYIVMVPADDDYEPLEIDAKSMTTRQAMRRSTMSAVHAKQMSTFIIRTMMIGSRICRRGVTSDWKLGGKESADMDGKDWRKLFGLMIDYWDDFLRACPEPFWTQQRISFHAYKIGQDNDINLKQCRDGTLANELAQMYDAPSVSTLMLALATNLRFMRARNVRGSLFDTAEIRQDYEEVRDANLRIFPMAFSPSVCSFQASKAPKSYQMTVLDPINAHLAIENGLGEGSAEVVKVILFQGYSVLKQFVRHRPGKHKLANGMYTACLCAPKLSTRNQAKRDGLWSEVENHLPFGQFDDAVAQAVETARIGSRYEPVVSINFQLLREENRNFPYICQRILFALMDWSRMGRDLYSKWCRLYVPEIFPGVLTDFSFMFRTLMQGFVRNSRSTGELGLIASEAVATIERLAAFSFTGNTAHIPSRVWKWIGLFQDLERYGWPYIQPSRIDLNRIPGPRARSAWRKDENTRNHVLTHLASVRFHFGDAAAISREASMSMLTDREIACVSSATEALRNIIRRFMVPELVNLITQCLREEHARLATTSSAYAVSSSSRGQSLREQSALVSEHSRKREVLLKRYAVSEHPLGQHVLRPLIKDFYQCSLEEPWAGCSSRQFPKAQTDVLQYIEVARLILLWTDLPDFTVDKPGSLKSIQRKSFVKPGMYWLDAMIETITTGRCSITQREWECALVDALKRESVVILPGPWNGLLSGRRFTRIMDYTGLDTSSYSTAVEGTNSSLKPISNKGMVLLYKNKSEFRTSLQSVFAHRTREAVAFPLAIPLQTFPADYVSGMESYIARYETHGNKTHRKGGSKQNIANYLRRAAGVLQLNNPQHNLFLLIGFILSRCSPPPVGIGYNAQRPHEKKLEFGAKAGSAKDEWYFIFIVRCLMYSNPEQVDRYSDKTCTSKEFTKVVEHKKITGRLLEILGICERTIGVREFPRMEELKVISAEIHGDKLRSAASASKTGARAVMGMWLSEDLLGNALAVLKNDSEDLEEDLT